MVQTYIVFVPEIGRSIGDQQKLGPGFLKRFRHIRVPAILADGAADPEVANRIRTAQRTRIIQAHFVENSLIRQVVL